MTKCPVCRVELDASLDACPECSFGYQVLLDYYNKKLSNAGLERELSILNDQAGILNARERKQCKKLLADFSKRFPGLYFSVYLESATDHDEADSKSLWLLNSSRFTDLPEGAHQQYGILLYIDANKSTAAMSMGAAFSPYLKARHTFCFLAACHSEFYRARYFNAITKVLRKTSSHLSERCPVFSKIHPDSSVS